MCIVVGVDDGGALLVLMRTAGITNGEGRLVLSERSQRNGILRLRQVKPALAV
jgi:hypothetical protein